MWRWIKLPRIRMNLYHSLGDYISMYIWINIYRITIIVTTFKDGVWTHGPLTGLGCSACSAASRARQEPHFSMLVSGEARLKEWTLICKAFRSMEYKWYNWCYYCCHYQHCYHYYHHNQYSYCSSLLLLLLSISYRYYHHSHYYCSIIVYYYCCSYQHYYH